MAVLWLFDKLEGFSSEPNTQTSGGNKSDEFKLCKVSVCPSSQPFLCSSFSFCLKKNNILKFLLKDLTIIVFNSCLREHEHNKLLDKAALSFVREWLLSCIVSASASTLSEWSWSIWVLINSLFLLCSGKMQWQLQLLVSQQKLLFSSLIVCFQLVVHRCAPSSWNLSPAPSVQAAFNPTYDCWMSALTSQWRLQPPWYLATHSLQLYFSLALCSLSQ